MKKKHLLLTIVIFFLLAIVFTVLFYKTTIDLTGSISKKNIKVSTISETNKKIVYIGVVSRYPPNIIYRGYQPLIDYLSNNSDFTFKLKLCEDYNQAVNQLANKEVSAAFLGSYLYVKTKEKFRLLPILKPLNENMEPYSRSVLFTYDKSDVFSLGDLKNKKLALPSKESYSSNWFIGNELSKHRILKKDLGTISYFPHHQTVIFNVLKGYYDVGVTREALLKKIRSLQYRILLYSETFPTSPLVVLEDCPKEISNTIQSVLLGIKHIKNNPQTIGWDNEFIYGFVRATDKDYDIIRQILNGSE